MAAKHHYFKGMKMRRITFFLQSPIILLTGAVFKRRTERRKMPAI
jgi:hypothetical protein